MFEVSLPFLRHTCNFHIRKPAHIHHPNPSKLHLHLPTEYKHSQDVLQTRHARQRYRLRLHRAESVVLSPQELVEIRAAQRTFEGAYIRTSLGQFSFALVVLKIFTAEFYSIGRCCPDAGSDLTKMGTHAVW